MAASVIRAGGRARRQAHVGMRLGNWLEESLIIVLFSIANMDRGILIYIDI